MKLVYLHGVVGFRDVDWLSGLNHGLAQIGVAPVPEGDVIAPRYAELLFEPGTAVDYPAVTSRQDDDLAARYAFERRQAEAERTIRRFDDVRTFGLERLVSDTLLERAHAAVIERAPINLLKQVKHYLQDDRVRGSVLAHILSELPRDGEIVLIGHSLGSVIAIDLLDHLPENLRVRRFITIGSPAGSPSVRKHGTRILRAFPYSRVGDWSNFLDPWDGVTAGRGLAAMFPGAQDFWIKSAATHSSEKYLDSPALATLIAQVIHPNATPTPAAAGTALRLSAAEASSLLTLSFAASMAQHIENRDSRQRFEAAVRALSESYLADLAAQDPGRALAPELAELAAGRLPAVPRLWNLSDAIAQVVVLAYSNPIAPHEIETGEASVRAIPGVIAALGFPSETGERVRAAVRQVNRILDGKRRSFDAKTRMALTAAGVALLATGPVGIAVSGSAGAAAFAGGMAAFGTGSTTGAVLGGLATLSGLASTSGMVAAAAQVAHPPARSGTRTVVLEPISIAIQVALACALADVGEPYDTDLWHRLSLAETDLAARINRLQSFSDPKSPMLRNLHTARDTISDLLEHLRTHGLVPEEVAELGEDGAD